jgi:hypothetical protein
VITPGSDEISASHSISSANLFAGPVLRMIRTAVVTGSWLKVIKYLDAGVTPHFILLPRRLLFRQENQLFTFLLSSKLRANIASTQLAASLHRSRSRTFAVRAKCYMHAYSIALFRIVTSAYMHLTCLPCASTLRGESSLHFTLCGQFSDRGIEFAYEGP